MGKGFHPLPVPVLEKGKALAKPHWRLRAPIPVAKMVSCRAAAGLGVSSCCGQAAVTCCGSVPSTKGFWGQGSGGLAGTIVVTQAPAWWGCGGTTGMGPHSIRGWEVHYKAEPGHRQHAAGHGKAKLGRGMDQLLQ